MIMEKKIQARRLEVEEIVLASLKCAIDEGLKLEDHEVIWRGDRGEYISSLLEDWRVDEDGDIAIDRLVSLIIH